VFFSQLIISAERGQWLRTYTNSTRRLTSTTQAGKLMFQPCHDDYPYIDKHAPLDAEQVFCTSTTSTIKFYSAP
jgi:hypothetical protein